MLKEVLLEETYKEVEGERRDMEEATQGYSLLWSPSHRLIPMEALESKLYFGV